MYGVTFLHVENVEIFDSPSYGLHLANVGNACIVNYSKFINPGDTYGGNDVLHLNGWCWNVQCFGIYGSAFDDTIAFCANDGNDLANAGTGPSAPTFQTGSVVKGPIRDCLVDGAYFDTGTAGRCLSSDATNSPISNITLRNYTVKNMINPFTLDNFSIPLGSGSYDNILLENYSVKTGTQWHGEAVLVATATVNNLTINNLQVIPTVANSTGGTAGAIMLNSNSTVSSLRVSGFDWENPGGLTAPSMIALEGTLTQGSFSKIRINQGTTLFSGAAIYCSGTIGDVILSDSYIDYALGVLVVGGGTTTLVQAQNISHTNQSTGALFSQTSGTFTTLMTSNVNTALLASGTIGKVNTGTTSNNVIFEMPTSAQYTCTTSWANVTSAFTPVQITLPMAGTWFLTSSVRGQIAGIYGSAGQQAFIQARLYDTTNSTALTNTYGIVCYTSLSAAITSGNAYVCVGFGPTPPFFYSVNGPTTITLQAQYYANTAGYGPQIVSDGNGPTNLAAIRIA